MADFLFDRSIRALPARFGHDETGARCALCTRCRGGIAYQTEAVDAGHHIFEQLMMG
jgi:hypothetical protein